MKTKQRALFALASALVLAGLCTFVLNRTILRAAAAGHTSLRYYTTPKRAVHSGDLLRNEDMEPLGWPATADVRGAIARREDAVNRVALVNIAPGEPLLESQLAPPGSGTGLASRIPNGMRAIALKSDEVIGVAGFLNPGSHVDVLVTCHSGFGGDAITTTVLQNVEVVATNQQIEPNPNGKPTTATVVTLLLTPPQAQRALLASNQGSLQLVLRNSSDMSTSDAAPIALSQIAPISQGLKAPGMPSSTPMPLSASVPSAASPLASANTSASPLQSPKSSTPANDGVEMVYGGGRSSQSGQPPMNLPGGKL